MFSNFDIVVAIAQDRCIGKDGKLPWHLSADMKHFRELTSSTSTPGSQNAVIMGRKTWESIPEKRRPLPGRHNIVISRTLEDVSGAHVARSLDEGLVVAETLEAENCFVIGGGEIYSAAIHHPKCRLLYLTHIEQRFDCDAFFPEYESHFDPVERSELFEENELYYRYYTFKRKAAVSQRNEG